MIDFDSVIERTGTDSMKWDVREGEISMGIADMDFQSAPCVREAVLRKAQFGIYGYADVPQAYYESYQRWWSRRHGWTPDTSWMMFSTGVVPAISSMVRKLTTPAEQVLVLSPVYQIFYHSILNNGRFVVSSPLVYTQDGYHIDFDDLEKKLADPQTTLMIFCNPHNPIGKIWDRETLARIGALCARHHVTVISDEIHCDLCAPGKEYVPFASVNETNERICVTCVSASKAFNLAGLQSACIIAADTLVCIDGQRLGKPRDEAEAEAMLRRLSGRDHTVMTGVSVLRGDRVETFTEKTQIHFRPLSAPEIRAYVATGEPMDKAGAYGIQGGAALFVSAICGDYYNVMGLPVCRLTQVLRSFGVCVLGVADGVVRGEAIE